ncbi:MAG TPA: cyclic nucleotide-binding domain-containing protein, partial [Steroidobacteraceae bacterium]|nr:cyclic nucleotide-binding domain-containing protein [Steroidobacteraceae bacterium]
MNAICRLTGLIALEGARSRRPTTALRSIPPGRVLFHAGTAATSMYAIRRGTVKLTRITADGDEEIQSFHTAGEVLGLEGFGHEVYAYDAVALDSVQYCELPLPKMDASPTQAPIASELVRLLSKRFWRGGPSRGSIRERVIAFLLDLSRRRAGRGLDGLNLKLAMSRMEIANFLGTRIETVSRVLQQLHREHAIQIRGS